MIRILVCGLLLCHFSYGQGKYFEYNVPQPKKITTADLAKLKGYDWRIDSCTWVLRGDTTEFKSFGSLSYNRNRTYNFNSLKGKWKIVRGRYLVHDLQKTTDRRSAKFGGIFTILAINDNQLILQKTLTSSGDMKRILHMRSEKKVNRPADILKETTSVRVDQHSLTTAAIPRDPVRQKWLDCRGDSGNILKPAIIFAARDSVNNADFWSFSSRFTPDSLTIELVNFLISDSNLANRTNFAGFPIDRTTYTQYLGYYTIDYDPIVLVNRFYSYHPEWQSHWIDAFSEHECHATVRVNLETFEVFDWQINK